MDLQRFFDLELRAGSGIQIAATLKWLCLYMSEALFVAKCSRVCVRILLLFLLIFFISNSNYCYLYMALFQRCHLTEDGIRYAETCLV